MRYTVLRNGGPLARCTDISANQYVNAGIDYDGTVYRYAVRVDQQERAGPARRPGRPPAFQAVGEPEAWGSLHRSPPRPGHQARSTSPSPDSNGKPLAGADLLRNGGWSRVDVTGAGTEASRYPDNDGPYALPARRLQRARAPACAPSGRTCRPTGPIVRDLITNMTWDNNGKNVKWSITVDATGTRRP